MNQENLWFHHHNRFKKMLKTATGKPPILRFQDVFHGSKVRRVHWQINNFRLPWKPGKTMTSLSRTEAIQRTLGSESESNDPRLENIMPKQTWTVFKPKIHWNWLVGNNFFYGQLIIPNRPGRLLISSWNQQSTRVLDTAQLSSQINTQDHGDHRARRERWDWRKGSVNQWSSKACVARIPNQSWDRDAPRQPDCV